jgi:hypothetical protein
MKHIWRWEELRGDPRERLGAPTMSSAPGKQSQVHRNQNLVQSTRSVAASLETVIIGAKPEMHGCKDRATHHLELEAVDGEVEMAAGAGDVERVD